MIERDESGDGHEKREACILGMGRVFGWVKVLVRQQERGAGEIVIYGMRKREEGV